MIECNQCGIWVHLSCAKIKKSNVPDIFYCHKCRDTRRSGHKKDPWIEGCEGRPGSPALTHIPLKWLSSSLLFVLQHPSSVLRCLPLMKPKLSPGWQHLVMPVSFDNHKHSHLLMVFCLCLPLWKLAMKHENKVRRVISISVKHKCNCLSCSVFLLKWDWHTVYWFEMLTARKYPLIVFMFCPTRKCTIS